MIEVGTRVRNVTTAQLGWIVENEAGQLAVKLDRRELTIVPYSPGQWHEDGERPIAPIQVARIAYEADRALRAVEGAYGVKEWTHIPEPERIRWLQGPPRDASKARVGLYKAVMGAFKPR